MEGTASFFTFGCLLTLASQCVALPLQSSLLIHLKFDDPIGSNSFVDSSPYGRTGTCRMSGASCPLPGQTGQLNSAVYFGYFCARTYGKDPAKTGEPLDRGNTISSSASCGSAVEFPAVAITDGLEGVLVASSYNSRHGGVLVQRGGFK